MISIIIPVRASGSPSLTLRSLSKQTFQDFEVIVSRDANGKGACWARNRGMERARGDLLLFCDDDIEWTPGALALLKKTLDANPQASYSYGAYRCGPRTNSEREFSAAALRRMNFVSTMSLVRREHHPGWDESLLRLQDWDVYLTMLESGHVGVFCKQVVFTTPVRDGITYGGGITWEDAVSAVKTKHGL